MEIIQVSIEVRKLGKQLQGNADDLDSLSEEARELVENLTAHVKNGVQGIAPDSGDDARLLRRFRLTLKEAGFGDLTVHLPKLPDEKA
jgi:nicotinic acid phosphoribosyltransferase